VPNLVARSDVAHLLLGASIPSWSQLWPKLLLRVLASCWRARIAFGLALISNIAASVGFDIADMLQGAGRIMSVIQFVAER
jgi:hypothetical protein